jgi:hypothetical protein
MRAQVFLLLMALSLAFSLSFADEACPRLALPKIVRSVGQFGPGVAAEGQSILLTLHCVQKTGVYFTHCSEYRFRLQRMDDQGKLHEQWLGNKNILVEKLQKEGDRFNLRKSLPKKDRGAVYQAITSPYYGTPYTIGPKNFKRLVKNLILGLED